MERVLGWQGGNEVGTVYWHSRDRVWSAFKPVDNRYWCSFGTSDPTSATMLAITCEINPPYEGINRQCAGAFARDESGQIYLTHSGKIGGGRQGIGKSTFLAAYRGDNRETLIWPDGMETTSIVIGRVDSARLLRQVAHFVHEVERFKGSVSRGEKQPLAAAVNFVLEFSGQRRSYRVHNLVESRSDHGLVVQELFDQLTERGHRVGNDQARDLFVASPSGSVKILFEVKTDLATSSVYQAVGQLMLHGAAEPTEPRRVLVLPGKPNPRTRAALERLKIAVLPYEWKQDRPVFGNLDRIF